VGAPKGSQNAKGHGKGRPAITVIPVSVGVPKKEIVLDQVLYWITLQATAQDIASSFHVCVDTLDTKLKEHFGLSFSELKKRTEGTGKLTLRRYQFQQAEKNTSMAIWLGKQWLGQKDIEEKSSMPPNDFNVTNQIDFAKLQHENKLLRDQLNALQPKTSGIDSGSDQAS